jgi:hypothetical protein
MPINSIKDKLMGALHDAVSNFNDGGDPNAAVVKAAQAHDFNTDQTTRLIEMFNSARTIYHYKTASDRTSAFALADPAVVIPAYYEEPEKEAAAHSGLQPDYAWYGTPEVDYRDNMLVKAGGAHNDVGLGQPVEHSDMSLDTLGKRAYDLMHVQRDLAETARTEAGVAGTKAGILLTKLAAELARGYEEVCIDRWQRLSATHMQKSAEFAPVLHKLAEFLPVWLRDAVVLEKVGEDVIEDRDLISEEEQLKEAKFWMESEAEMLAYSGEITKEADAFNVDFTTMVVNEFPEARAQSLADFCKVGGTTTTTSRKKTDAEPITQKLFGFGEPFDQDSKTVNEPVIGKAISEAIGEGVKKPGGEWAASGVTSMLTGPAERANVAMSDRLRNVQRQVMLEELMTNDPVLADEDPEIVASAYSTILKIAPEVATNKEVVRAILRESVHSLAISPLTAQSWVELEKDLLTVTGRLPGREAQPGGIKK